MYYGLKSAVAKLWDNKSDLSISMVTWHLWGLSVV